MTVLMEADFGSDVAHVQRRQDSALGHAHRMKFSLQRALPKVQELVQHRKFGCHVEFLPNECLEQARVVGHVVEDLRRGQTVAFEHQVELAHVLLPQVKRQTEETHRWVRGAERCTVHSVTPIRESIVAMSSRRRREKPLRKNDERGLFLSDSVLAATVSFLC